jgi:hypothetical protein
MSLARRAILRALISVIACAHICCAVAALAGKNDEAWLTTAIQRQAVQSSNLASIGYHRGLRVLEIEFQSGAIYRYREVPLDIFADLMRAESKGRFFIEKVRGRYSFQKTVGPR